MGRIKRKFIKNIIDQKYLKNFLLYIKDNLNVIHSFKRTRNNMIQYSTFLRELIRYFWIYYESNEKLHKLKKILKYIKIHLKLSKYIIMKADSFMFNYYSNLHIQLEKSLKKLGVKKFKLL